MGYLGTEWKKSSYSGGGEGNDCVEIARVPPHIAIRDSKAPSRAALTFPAGAFVTFVEALKDGGRALRRDALTPTGGWQPTERVAALLFVDFDGMAAGPEDVISDGLDGGYRSRTGALRSIRGAAPGRPGPRPRRAAAARASRGSGDPARSTPVNPSLARLTRLLPPPPDVSGKDGAAVEKAPGTELPEDPAPRSGCTARATPSPSPPRPALCSSRAASASPR
ncbi:DUF397 domain-containing protein [Streptomyces thermoviolaceus]